MEGKLNSNSHNEAMSYAFIDFTLLKELNGAVSSSAAATTGMVDVDALWKTATAPSFVPVNGSSTSSTARTVSPKDLELSAPASSAITNLTSPSVQESPYDLADSYETSPLFPGDDALAISAGSYSLFPETVLETTDSLERSASLQSLEGSSSNESPVTLNAGSGQRASVNASPHFSGAPMRHSSVSGVKGRRRNKPLAPITFDPSDKTAAKRARNTESARQSRQRRYEQEERMKDELAERDAEIAKLKKSNDYWKQVALSKGFSETM